MKKINNCIGFLYIVLMVIFLSGCKEKQEEMFVIAQEKNTSPGVSESVSAEVSEDEPCTAFVFICGAVVTPGVYEVPAGSRLYEVVNLAGGLTEEAALDYLNQAEIVKDGQKIKVPIIGEEDVAQDNNQGSENTDRRININTAQEESLITLTGIGSSRAKDIISYREKNDGFKSVEEIKNVPGIKDGLYNKIKDSITVD